MTTKKSEARRFLEKLTSGPLTMGRILSSTRKCEEMKQAEFAKILGITVPHLSDIENGRKAVSPERAARFARALGLSEKQFVRVALQDELNRQGLEKYQVSIEAA
ncbi:MAG TPA: XRE family transcriptional regulator [Deltaproteobacteria bacterium]|nr:XRE family transcriptional regulator [Deltaproteobacteria bacterium]